MAESAPFPYETRLNILHGPLQLIDVHAVPGADNYKWFNQTLCKVNDSVVRMAAIEGEYHWHKHDDDDEFFYVVDGELLIDLRRPYGFAPARPGICGSENSRPPHPRAESHHDPDGRERRHHPYWKLTRHAGSMASLGRLQLHTDHPQVTCSHVLKSVRRQRGRPECSAFGWLRDGAAVHEY